MFLVPQSSYGNLLVVLLCAVFTMKLGCIVWIRVVLDDVTNSPPHGGALDDGAQEWDIGDTLASVRMSVEDTVHYQMDDPTADAEWDALTPGRGLVYLGPNRQPFTPSLFHRLRCLNLIRKAVVEVDALGGVHPDYPSDLTKHCVGYLRQMVLCRADADIDVVLGGTEPSVYLNVYQCRDWSNVYDAVGRNQKSRASASSQRM